MGWEKVMCWRKKKNYQLLQYMSNLLRIEDHKIQGNAHINLNRDLTLKVSEWIPQLLVVQYENDRNGERVYDIYQDCDHQTLCFVF